MIEWIFFVDVVGKRFLWGNGRGGIYTSLFDWNRMEEMLTIPE